MKCDSTFTDTTWITPRGRRRGSGRSRCRRAGRCGATRAGACTTWTTTRAPPRGSGPTRSAWRASSTGAASGATWWRRATSASCTRSPRRRPRPRPRPTTSPRQVSHAYRPDPYSHLLVRIGYVDVCRRRSVLEDGGHTKFHLIWAI